MLIGSHQDRVIQNIKDAAENREFAKKVEVDDPNLSLEEQGKIINTYLQQKYSLGYSLCNMAARIITWAGTRAMNHSTRIEGLENIKGIHGGAIITSNHFNPMDNTVIREAIYKAFHRRIYIVSQATNLGMTGMIGFLMKFADIIPYYGTTHYISDYFGPTIKDMLMEGEKILIYPEQEMWLNYRKPRPPKRGAYYYAAVNEVPIISCFVEIKTLPKKESDEFYRTGYVMHILPTIYPDPTKRVRENSYNMMAQDYQQKIEAYEKAYGRPLTYDFEAGDIAGWIPGETGAASKE